MTLVVSFHISLRRRYLLLGSPLPLRCRPPLLLLLTRQQSLAIMEEAAAASATATSDGKRNAAATIEVERKFLLPQDMLGLRSRLHAEGAALVGTQLFTDAYFDTPSFRLTLADMWLRKRDGVWELKIPGAHVDGTAVYTELETEPEIASALIQHFGKCNGAHDDAHAGAQAGTAEKMGLESLIALHGLDAFATFETARESYCIGSFKIDLDQASFGDGTTYGVGEIELMCASAAEVAHAAAKIDALGAKLALAMAAKKGQLRSKVSTILMRERPAHFAALTDAGGNLTSMRHRPPAISYTVDQSLRAS